MRQQPSQPPERQRPSLLVHREEAKQKIEAVIERGTPLASEKITESDPAHRWYEYVDDLLKSLFSTNELADFFTGRGTQYRSDGDVHVRKYIGRLESIRDRLEFYSEHIPLPEPGTFEPEIIIARLAQRFHLVARQLRQRHGGRDTLDINDEYDVQDLFHALLKLFFDDIRPEEWTPSYAGGSARMDFLLKKEQTVIELKKTRQGLTTKEIGDQLAIDIHRYTAHEDCRSLICFVYDPEGRIGNPDGLERDLSGQINALKVTIFIAPKGH